MTMKASYFEGQGRGVATPQTGRPSRPTCPRTHRLRSASLTGPRGRRGARRPLLRPAYTVCRRNRRAPGCELLNDVVLNQVLFRFEDDDATNAVLTLVQESGEAWMGGTTWEGRAAIRVSVSGWRTTEADIDRTVAAFESATRHGLTSDHGRKRADDSHESELGTWELVLRAPDARLRALVGDYEGYEESGSPPPLRQQPPTTRLPVIVNFGAPGSSPHQPMACARSIAALSPGSATDRRTSPPQGRRAVSR
jgi:hypothetical protein